MVVRQIDTYTTTNCRVVLLNTGTTAATFTDLPIKLVVHP